MSCTTSFSVLLFRDGRTVENRIHTSRGSGFNIKSVNDAIRQEFGEYKYKNELHINEIILLAYYIAAINIEEAYHGIIEANISRLKVSY